MKSLAENGNGANTLVGAPSVSRSVGGSLRDVQSLARHSSLQMTQRYIEVSEDAMKKVVGQAERVSIGHWVRRDFLTQHPL